MKRTLATRTPKIHVSLGPGTVHRRYLWLTLCLALCSLAAAGYLGYRLLQAEARIAALEQRVTDLREPHLPLQLEGIENEEDAAALQPAESWEPDPGPHADDDPQTDEIDGPPVPSLDDIEEPEESDSLDLEAPDAGSTSPPAQSLPEEAPSGPWIINLVSYFREQDAQRFLEQAHAMEIPAESVEITSGEKTIWRLTVSGFHSASEAREYGETVKDKLRLTSIWVSRD